MPSYSLHIEIPGEPERYVKSHDFPSEMRPGDEFTFDGYRLRVVGVATKQFDAEGEPPTTLRCLPA
jgi:hypothetical protein